MKCPHCKEEIHIDHPEKYFVKVVCYYCGGIITFDKKKV